MYWGIIILLSYAINIVNFYLFYNGAVDMQIWAFLTISQCRVSDTGVTGEAWSLLYLQVISTAKTQL